MDKANIDYILDIFKTLTTELPEQMLYRESGDTIELRTLDSTMAYALDSNDKPWNLINCCMAEPA